MKNVILHLAVVNEFTFKISSLVYKIFNGNISSDEINNEREDILNAIKVKYPNATDFAIATTRGDQWTNMMPFEIFLKENKGILSMHHRDYQLIKNGIGKLTFNLFIGVVLKIEEDQPLGDNMEFSQWIPKTAGDHLYGSLPIPYQFDKGVLIYPVYHPLIGIRENGDLEFKTDKNEVVKFGNIGSLNLTQLKKITDYLEFDDNKFDNLPNELSWINDLNDLSEDDPMEFARVVMNGLEEQGYTATDNDLGGGLMQLAKLDWKLDLDRKNNEKGN